LQSPALERGEELRRLEELRHGNSLLPCLLTRVPVALEGEEDHEREQHREGGADDAENPCRAVRIREEAAARRERPYPDLRGNAHCHHASDDEEREPEVHAPDFPMSSRLRQQQPNAEGRSTGLRAR
jgi:hypothetical protein